MKCQNLQFSHCYPFPRRAPAWIGGTWATAPPPGGPTSGMAWYGVLRDKETTEALPWYSQLILFWGPQ